MFFYKYATLSFYIDSMWICVSYRMIPVFTVYDVYQPHELEDAIVPETISDLCYFAYTLREHVTFKKCV